MNDDPVRTIARDSSWLAHRYDPGRDTIHFLNVPRAAHRRATFLTDQYLASDRPPAVVERRAAVAAARDMSGPVHFIFHAAFCCSTLVARALDRPGWAMGLKEPVILNDLVGWRRRGATLPQLRPVLDDALTLLGRPFEPGEAVAIKPSNLVNGLAMTMMDLRPDARALLMYAPLPDFLASIAKKGLDGHIFVRELFLHQLKDGMGRLGFDQDQLFLQSDLQIAAMGWLVQIKLFGEMVKQFGNERIRTISSDALLVDSERSVRAIAMLLGLSSDGPTVTAVANGPGFTTHSKSGVAFGSEQRLSEVAAAAEHHADEIAKILIWARRVADQAGISLNPGAPLLSDQRRPGRRATTGLISDRAKHPRVRR